MPPSTKLTFPELVAAELYRAREKYPPHTSLEHSMYVLLREADELKQEIDMPIEFRVLSAILAESVQVAAMAQRLAEAHGAIDFQLGHFDARDDG